MSDRDIMQRLLDTEREASRLVSEAEAESRRRLQAVSDELKSAALEALRQRRKELEAELEELKRSLLKEQQRSMSEYEAGLASTPLDPESFYREVDRLIADIGEEGSM